MRYLCVVVEEEHLTRAAERLGIRASSLSQQIIALEKELDTQLFTRTPGGMVPTAAAEALLPHARRMLDAADLAVRAVRDAANQAERPLHIGITPGAPPSVLPVLHAVEGVELRDHSAARQLELLRRGALDAGLIALPEELDGLRAVVVSDVPLGVLVRRDHALAGLDDVDWGDLADQDLLLYERELAPGYHDALLAQCAANGWRPGRVRVGPPRRSLFVAELLHGGELVALRPHWDSSDLRWLPLRANPIHVRHALVWDPDCEVSHRIEPLAVQLPRP